MPIPSAFQPITSQSRPRRSGAIHRTGLIIAAGCAVTLAVVLVLIARISTTSSPQKFAEQSAQKPSTPNLANVPALTTSQGGLTQGEKFFMQFADRADATRIAGEVTADTSQPLPERRYQLTKPVAWFFTTDGRSIYVEANEGQMRVASEAARATTGKTSSVSGGSGGVETGSLVGNVLIRVYEATTDGSRPDIKTAEPFAILRTSRVSVDWLLGQMEVPESFDARWRTLDYAGQGAVVQFDPATRIVDSIAIAKTREVIIRPSRKESTASATLSSTASPADSSSTSSPATQSTTGSTTHETAVTSRGNPQANAPKAQRATQPREAKQVNATTDSDEAAAGTESFYSINTPSTLTVSQGEGLTLTAASLQAYARLIDGTIARTNQDDATEASPKSTQPIDQSPQTAKRAGTNTTSPANSPATTTSQPPTTPAQPNSLREQSQGDLPTRLTLAGPIEVRRILKAPQELARDAWWATLQSSAVQRITAHDTTRGLSLLADTAEIAGTRQLLTLNATGEAALLIQSRDAGNLTARTMQLDQQTNIARVVGAGMLVAQAQQSTVAESSIKQPASLQDTPKDAPTIRWREKAEFTFARESADTPATSTSARLTRAHFLGAVDATSSGATVRANELVTQFDTFARTTPNNTQVQVTLPTLSQAIGQASVTDAAHALFTADVITVKFTPSADMTSAIPTTFVGAGMASARIPHVAKNAQANSTPSQPGPAQAFDQLTAREISGSFHSVPRDATQQTFDNASDKQTLPATAIQLATLIATGTALEPVAFQSHDNVRATSLSLAADVPGQEVTLDGTPQRPATLVRDESNIAGPKIILNGLKRTAQLPMGGRMELREAAIKDADAVNTKPLASLVASADGPITYDESAATATMTNNVVATLEDGVQSSRLNAATVTVTFVAPKAADANEESRNNTSTGAVSNLPNSISDDSPTSSPTPFAANLQVSSVIATGSANQPASATISNKPATENAAVSTYFVEAPRLTALATGRAFEATGPGRLLAHIGAAEKPAQPIPANSATKFDATSAGDTLVQWQQGMSFRESESLATATGRVRLAHREVAGTNPSLMECETLSLTLAPTQLNQQNQPNQTIPPRESSAMGSLFSNTAFTSALAEGGVWGNLQGQEFTSVTATYDVTAGTLEARGDATTPVTIAAAPAKNGAAATSPLTAARVKITTRDGRVEVIDPGTVQTGPR